MSYENLTHNWIFNAISQFHIKNCPIKNRFDCIHDKEKTWKKENDEKGKNKRGHSKTHRYSPCSPSCRHDIKYRLKKERWMADTWLKTGLVLVTRSQRNEAVGCSTVQVGCQMARTETVNEGTKRNERNTVHHEYATRQTRPRELNTNFEFLSRDSGHLFSFCSTRCKIPHNYKEKKSI